MLQCLGHLCNSRLRLLIAAIIAFFLAALLLPTFAHANEASAVITAEADVPATISDEPTITNTPPANSQGAPTTEGGFDTVSSNEQTNDTFIGPQVPESFVYNVIIPQSEATVINPAEDAAKTVFAIYSATDNSLNFYNRESIPTLNTTFNGRTVTAVYTGFENKSYAWNDTSGTKTPWHAEGRQNQVTTVTVVDEFAPKYVANWFFQFTKLVTADIHKLNVSNLSTFVYGSTNYAGNIDLFYGCTNLETIKVNEGWKDDWFIPSKNSNSMYNNCSKLRQIISTTTVSFAVYDDKAKTLTFHKQNTVPVGGKSFEFTDTNGDKHTATHVYLNPEQVAFENNDSLYIRANLPWYHDVQNATSVTIVDTISPTSMYAWFFEGSNIVTADLHKVDPSNLTNIEWIFERCESLTSFSFPDFSTGSLTKTAGIFSWCKSLTSINLRNFNFSNIESPDFMFRGCEALEVIYVNDTWKDNWCVVDTSSNMYLYCYKLARFESTRAIAFAVYNDADKSLNFYKRKTIPVGGSQFLDKPATKVFPTVEVYDQLNTGDSTSAKVPWYPIRSNVTNVTVIDNGIQPISMCLWFSHFTALTSIDITKLDTSKNTSLGETFAFCSELGSIDLSHLNTDKVDDIGWIFYKSEKLKTLDLSKLNLKNVTRAVSAFDLCTSLETIYVNDTWVEDWFMTHKHSDMYLDCNALVRFISTIPIAFAVYDSVNGNTFTFHKQYSATYKGWIVPVAGINGNVHTFIDNEGKERTLTRVYTGIETTNYSYSPRVDPPWYDDTNRQFASAYAVDTISPISMCDWFWHCGNLLSADLHKIDTSRVANMFCMFQACEKLTFVDVSTFDTSNVTNMCGLFDMCRALTSVDLTSFNTDKVTDMSQMFRYDGELVTIYAGNWNISNVVKSDNIFLDCSKLIGGNGTKYNSSHAHDRTYTRIDTSETPGYFTLVLNPKLLDVGDIDSITWDPTGAEGKSTITLPITHEDPVTHESVTTNVTLTEGTHYTISYVNNANTGKATATITILGTYTGNPDRTFTREFQVTPASMSDATASIDPGKLTQLSSGKYAFTGTALQPEIGLTLNGAPVNSDDYTVSYSSNLDAGTATVTITGNGNISGSQVVTFEIEKVSINDLTFSWNGDDLTYTGSEVKPSFNFTIKDADGKDITIDSSNYDVTYSNNINAGTATLTITGKKSIKDEVKEVTFSIAPANLDGTNVSVILSNTSYIYTGGTFSPGVTVKLGDFTVSSDDYSVAPSGRTDVGEATVAVTAKDGGNFTGSNAATFEITPKSLAGASFTFTPANAQYTFTGFEITPAFSVALGGTTLFANSTKPDFTVAYEGDQTNVGTVRVIITGANNYKDTASSTFQIVAANLADTIIALSDNPEIFKNNSYDYTGNAHEPTVSLKLGSYTLPENSYKVTYSNNINASTEGNPATITITPISTNFTGTQSATFIINKVAISTVLTKPGAITIGGMDYIDEETKQPIKFEAEYTGSELIPNIVIQAGDTELVKGTDYDISCSDNVNVGDVTLTITGKSESLEGTHNIVFHIAPAKITNNDIIIEGIEDQKFINGTLSTPEVSLSYHGKQLEEDKDYTLKYSDNEKPGEGHITITGKGNFAAVDEAGELISSTIAFRIVKGLVNDATFAFDPALLLEGISYPIYTYDGSAHTPAFTLIEGEKQLVEGTDFTFKYLNNINAGTATIVIEGKEDFGGIINKTFLIQPAIIDVEGNEAVITIDQTLAIPGYKNVFVYDGVAIEPGVTVTFNGVQLVYGTDYTLSYSDNGNPGSIIIVPAKVTIRGKDNYDGTVSASFVIKKKPEIIEGHGQSWITESTNHATFKSDAPLDELQNIKVDGTLLSHETHYTLDEGSTIVHLKPEFLSTLAPGEHSIDVESLAGIAHATFTIAAKPVDATNNNASNSNSNSSVTNTNQGSNSNKATYYLSSSTSAYRWQSSKLSNMSNTNSDSTDILNIAPVEKAYADTPNKSSELNNNLNNDNRDKSLIQSLAPWIVGVAAVAFILLLLARRRKEDEE